MERLCLDCNQPVKGRSDKKFCDDQCRSNYNNRLKSVDSTYFKQVNTILKKNRQILEKLNTEGKTKTTKAKLLKAGFNFDFYTNHYRTQKGNTYYFCYEQGYISITDEDYLLVKREEHI